MIPTIITPMNDTSFINALIVGVSIALLASQIGIFVVGKKLSFLGDTLSHGAFTGIAIGLLIGIHPTITIFTFAVALALILTWLQEKSELSNDTYLAIFFSSLLALGIMIFGEEIELNEYLFGDINNVQFLDMLIAITVSGVVLSTLWLNFRKFIMTVVDKDIAQTKGINVSRYNYLFVVLLALTTAVTIKVIGILLFSALLVIPAASALILAKNLARSFVYSWVIAEMMVILGLFISYYGHTPSGPTMIIVGTGIFILSNIYRLVDKP